jgi:hypothetical protein
LIKESLLHNKWEISFLAILFLSLTFSWSFGETFQERTSELETQFQEYFMQDGVDQSNAVYGRLEAGHEALFSSTGDTLAVFEARVDSIFNVMKPRQKKLMDLDESADSTDLFIELTGIQLEYYQANAACAAYKLSRLTRIRDSRTILDENFKNIGLALADYNQWLNQDGPLEFRDALVALLVDVRVSGSSTQKDDLLPRIRKLRRALVGYYRESAQRLGAESVVVEVLVGDEPCFLLVDTGAELVTLPAALITALGWDKLPGTEREFSLAGGKKAKGKYVVFPKVSYDGFLVRDVEAGILPSGNLGFDGLLGMSYLGHFLLEIDLAAEMPLKLKQK